ncbi:tetratricopeptide repeat protein [Pseudorhodoferax sp. Leaf267]|uniref:tetratricopeptide repeat protein n=1 Tax=Pseudorhodoferax sp. Leaf267 TaxID=1736316 RepID=UPI0006F8F526|nr:tetratricopeptide repeat protein [Pseudorhodoferax sp. Leaf267]KQP23289.1 hypothetical protein ASF43_05320 [Pseudorhodoferax sp. Leaf267]
MNAAAGPGMWSLRRVQATLGLSRRVVQGLIAEHVVQPERGPRNQMRFTFQDLVLLRTAFGLQHAKVPPRRILQALAKLRADLPPSLPLSGLRITAEGADVVVRGADGPREAISGQLVLDFEVLAREEGSLTLLNVGEAGPSVGKASDTTRLAEAHFQRAEALEDTDRAASLEAYRQALALNPAHPCASVNLGALLCEDGSCEEAVAVFESALRHGVADALLHFNHAVALEDVGQYEAAQASYEVALTLDPQLADAHFNLARLLSVQGDLQGAVRHWNAYRRLQSQLIV